MYTYNDVSIKQTVTNNHLPDIVILFPSLAVSNCWRSVTRILRELSMVKPSKPLGSPDEIVRVIVHLVVVEMDHGVERNSISRNLYERRGDQLAQRLLDLDTIASNHPNHGNAATILQDCKDAPSLFVAHPAIRANRVSRKVFDRNPYFHLSPSGHFQDFSRKLFSKPLYV